MPGCRMAITHIWPATIAIATKTVLAGESFSWNSRARFRLVIGVTGDEEFPKVDRPWDNDPRAAWPDHCFRSYGSADVWPNVDPPRQGPTGSSMARPGAVT